jgi:hypothetical protein
MRALGPLDISLLRHSAVIEALQEMIPFTDTEISANHDGIANDIRFNNRLVGLALSPDLASFGDLGPRPSDLLHPVKIHQNKVVHGNEFPEVFESFAFVVARNRGRVLVGILPSEGLGTPYAVIFFGWLPANSIEYINVFPTSERIH